MQLLDDAEYGHLVGGDGQLLHYRSVWKVRTLFEKRERDYRTLSPERRRRYLPLRRRVLQRGPARRETRPNVQCVSLYRRAGQSALPPLLLGPQGARRPELLARCLPIIEDPFPPPLNVHHLANGPVGNCAEGPGERPKVHTRNLQRRCLDPWTGGPEGCAGLVHESHEGRI